MEKDYSSGSSSEESSSDSVGNKIYYNPGSDSVGNKIYYNPGSDSDSVGNKIYYSPDSVDDSPKARLPPKIDTSILREIENKTGLEILDQEPIFGTYGTIYFAVNEIGEKFVIKISHQEIIFNDVVNEISSLTILQEYKYFPKIISIVMLTDPTKCALVITYCGRPVNNYLIMNFDRISMVFNLLDAYECIYRIGIVHRDIKNNNICIQDDGSLSIIDFGYAIRAPFHYHKMELIDLNKHIETFADTYPTEFTNKVDLIGLFNAMVYFIVAKQNYGTAFNIYPVTFASETDQLFNLSYLLLANQNTREKRQRIFEFVQKTVSKSVIEKISLDEISFHKQFEETADNHEIFEHYRNIIHAVPKDLYKWMKKILNLNPKTRINFRKFYNGIKNIKVMHRQFTFELVFGQETMFSIEDAQSHYFFIVFDQTFPTTTYALTFYHFFHTKDFFSIQDREQLFHTIAYINYCSRYEDVEPNYIGITLDYHLFKEYMQLMHNDLHGTSPYTYQHLMWFIKWNHQHKLIFDYFITIASTHPFFIAIHPFVLCLIATTLIYRIHHKINIQIDIEPGSVRIPNSDIVPIPVTRQTFNTIFLNNPSFTILANKFYGYYAALSINNKLVNLDKYYASKTSVPKLVQFYQCQITKFFINL